MSVLLVVVGAALGLGVYFYSSDDDQIPTKDKWCSTEVVKSVKGCGDQGCVYVLESGGLEANEKGYEVGQEIEVCRAEKPQKELPEKEPLSN